MINTIAQAIVDVVKAGHRHKGWLSAGALVMTLLVGVAYLLLGALGWNPFASVYRVTLELPASGGLLPNQDVTLRGVRIGKVEKLSIVPAGVNAEVRLDAAVKLSESSKARVAGLSAAGEQYIDFDGGNGKAPFLTNGGTFAMGRTEIPVTLADLLAHSDGMLKQIDTKKLEIIKHELSLSDAGPQKLSDIVEGGTFLLSALDGVLPQTTRLLNTSRITLQLVADKNEGMKVAAANLDAVFGGVSRMTGGFRTLTEQAPKTFAATDTLFADNSDTMVQLLGDLTTSTQLMYVRVPALNALFPTDRGSLFDSLSSIIHDEGFWVSADIYPRYACDYGTPRHPPSSADYPEPFMYTYCRDDDPAVLIRGAKNAPRPAGDDTYGPPMGADLGKQTDPSPEGRFSIPTPYGGPTLPMEPPR
ncbi:MAG: MCE family protein [Mycobacterium sp.]|nr:MCE family protein [Mycobacterium sp.]